LKHAKKRLFITAGILAAAGCDRAPLANQHDMLGTVGVALQVAPGVSLTSASYLITGANGFTRTDNVPVGSSANVAVMVSDLPVADGYDIAVSGVASDMTTVCSGSGHFSVQADAMSKVIVHLVCGPHATGAADLGTTINVCPVLDELSASPAEVLVGHALALIASSHDADHGPSPLAYAWSASSGALSSASGTQPTFTCATAGLASIAVTVSDGDPHPGCTSGLTIQVSCTAP
jgi:hypothetical protein